MADTKPNPCIVKLNLCTCYLNSPPFGRAITQWSVDVLVCRRFGVSTFWPVDVLVCRRFGLSTFWFVDVWVCRRVGLSTFWSVDVSVCRRFGLSTFRFVDVLVVDVSVCRRFDQLPGTWSSSADGRRQAIIWTNAGIIPGTEFCCPQTGESLFILFTVNCIYKVNPKNCLPLLLSWIVIRNHYSDVPWEIYRLKSTVPWQFSQTNYCPFEGNLPFTGAFHSQRTDNAENISILLIRCFRAR